MGLYIVKTVRERPQLVIDVMIKLKDGRAMVVPAYLSKVLKIYAQYELDVGNMDKHAIDKFRGKRTRFVAPSPKECDGTYENDGFSLLATVSFSGDTTICDIPKYAIISIEGDNGDEIQRCGMFHGIAGYDVEYHVCLPKDITPDDVDFVR